jgi:hypothetical protein
MFFGGVLTGNNDFWTLTMGQLDRQVATVTFEGQEEIIPTEFPNTGDKVTLITGSGANPATQEFISSTDPQLYVRESDEKLVLIDESSSFDDSVKVKNNLYLDDITGFSLAFYGDQEVITTAGFTATAGDIISVNVAATASAGTINMSVIAQMWNGSAWSTFTADQMNSERQVNTTTTTTTFIIPSVTIPTGFTKIRWLFTHNSSGNTDTITVSYVKIDSVYTITQLNKIGLGVFQSPTTFAKISKGEVSVQGQPIFFGGGTLYVAGDDLWWKKGALNVKLS